MRSQSHCLFCCILTNARDFKQNPSRFNYCDPMVNSALAAAHAGFRRLLGNGFVWENANPHVPAPAQVVSDSPPSRLNLSGGKPRWLQRLQTIVTESNFITHMGFALKAPSMGFAMFNSFRL
jgi:hypothetical protein